MILEKQPVCMACKHYDREDLKKPSCAAFPVGIPDEIWLQGNDHTKPFPGDKGIRFERKGE